MGLSHTTHKVRFKLVDRQKAIMIKNKEYTDAKSIEYDSSSPTEHESDNDQKDDYVNISFEDKLGLATRLANIYIGTSKHKNIESALIDYELEHNKESLVKVIDEEFGDIIRSRIKAKKNLPSESSHILYSIFVFNPHSQSCCDCESNCRKRVSGPSS